VSLDISVPTPSPAKRLGAKLREARENAGYTSQKAFSVDLQQSRSLVSKIESGDKKVTDDVLKRWCRLTNVDYELYAGLAQLARSTSSPVPLWFRDFAAAQRMAHTIRTWHPIIVPGPLQTPEYARVLFASLGASDDRIDSLVAARMDLQQIITRPNPVTLLAVIDESVLHRLVGSPEIMHGQLTHLVELGQRQSVGIQVVPARRGGNAGHVGAFTLASLPEGQDALLMDAIEDVTTDQRPSILKAVAILDRVRLDALSKADSLDLITELAERWKPETYPTDASPATAATADKTA
jgi:transcriptional regulator with XRE-family HTH domain